MKEKILKKIKNKKISLVSSGLVMLVYLWRWKKPKRDLKLSVSIFRRKS